nr:right-handed parallel beta-helix repeat-containing protein [Loktanella sp. M215]
MSKATGGETFLLNGGNYGDLSLNAKSGFNITFANDVTIASADPDHPATITGLDVRGARNLTFDGITFDYTFAAGDQIYERPFNVSGSQNITISNSTFDGDVASGVSDVSDGYGYAIGLSFRNSTGVSVENNEFFNFHRGLTVAESGDVVVSGNDIHDIRMDGMNFSEIDGVVIEGNYIHDFRGSPNSLDHSDMIQFWTNGTDSPSRDIVIRDNYLDIGNGSATQSIFMRNDQVDRGLAGAEMFYQNITIENNVITNAHLHGITVGETAGLAIRNNTVLHADGANVDGADASVEIPMINVSAASQNVVISSNAVAEINGFTQQKGWTLTNNAFVQDQDPYGFGFYGNEFIASSMNAANGVHAFNALTGGMLDRLNAGASTTLTQPGSGIVTAFHAQNNAEDQASVHFDASYSQINTANLPTGTRFLWAFGDGTKAEGLTVDHAYVDGGKYNVTLTIVLPDGRSDSKSLTVALQSSEVVSFVHGHGFVVDDYGVDKAIAHVAAETADGLVIRKTGVAAQIDHVYVDRILNKDNFEMSLSVAAATSNSAGEIVRLHGSFVASVTAKGELSLDINTAAGKRIVLTTDGAHLSDRATHDIDISLASGILSIKVDGTVLAQSEMDGGLASLGNRDLTFGNPWGKQNFDGIVTAFDLNVDADDFAAAREAMAHLQSDVDSIGSPTPQPAPDSSDLSAGATTGAEKLAPTAPSPSVFETHLLEYSVGKDFKSYLIGDLDIETRIHADIGGIDLGGKGVTVSVGRAYADDILGSDNFQIAMSLKADTSGSAGEVVRLHSSFVTSIDAKGELFVQVFSTEEGRIRLKTDGAHLNDTKEHDVSLTLDNGILSVEVNGRVMASTEMRGVLVSEGRHDLSFGNAWGKDNFDGHMSSFTIATKDALPASADHAPEKFIVNDAFSTADHHIPQHDMDITYDTHSGVISAYL